MSFWVPQPPSSPTSGGERQHLHLPLHSLGLLAAALAIFFLLFPRIQLRTLIQRDQRPSAAALSYLRLMIKASPGQTDLQLLLASRALAAGNLALASSALRPWESGKETMTPEAAALRLSLATMRMNRLPPAARGYPQALARYRQIIQATAPYLDYRMLREQADRAQAAGLQSMAALLDVEALRRGPGSAKALEAYGAAIRALVAGDHPLKALQLAQRQLPLVPHDAALWRQLSQLANSANRPAQGARYARQWLLASTSSQERRRAFKAVIAAELAADDPRSALVQAQGLLARIKPNRPIWRLLTRVALQANDAKAAANYARKLTGMESAP